MTYRMLLPWFVIVLGLCHVPASAQLPALPIVEGDTWRYYKGTSTPSLQGTNQWYRPEFNDATWGGPAPSGFGYGDCDDAFELGDMPTNYIAIFTRRAFRVDNPAAVSHLTLAADYDDGLVVYLNGAEVARLNMPGGAITRHTAASGNHEASRGNGAAPPVPKEYVTLDPALLRTGTNLIAVSGHNVSTNSSDFSLVVELYTNASLVRGPFIQMPSNGPSVALAWQTAALVDSVVDYGLDLSYGSGTVSNGTPKRDHTVHLAGLLPGTSYYYRVRGGGATLVEGQVLRTRPAPDQSFRFVVIGDHGQGTAQMYTIASLINARTDFDAILTVGDNVYGTSPCSLDGAPGWYDPYWFKLYAPTMRRVATFPALGNHDWYTASGQYMVDYFRLPTNGPVNHIGKNYSFDLGPIHFVVVDTEPYEDNTTATITEINNWLSADLAATTQRWRMALLHRPPYTTLGSHDDNPRVKAHIVPRLKAGGVQMVFQGHNHWYERINPIDGTHYITTGGAGSGLYSVGVRKEYSARMYNTRHSYTLVDLQGGRLYLQQINDLGEVVDEHRMDLDHPFALDGLLDNPAWVRASNGLNLYAAIRGYHLYVATQDAGESSDHFIYVAGQPGVLQAANWAKAGSAMAWSAFLADENDGAFHGWFNAAQAQQVDFTRYKSVTSGLNNNGTNGNGVLEGSLDLVGHFGSFPTQLWMAAAPYATADGGALVGVAQVPAGDGDGDLEPGEFLVLNPRELALDLPVAEAGGPLATEAGFPLALDGSGSGSPAGLPLGFLWQPQSGPAALILSNGVTQTTVVITQAVASATTAVVRLTVNDTRFDSTDTVSITVNPVADSDGDGLSDLEEQTGINNVLTWPDPGGWTSRVDAADSDGDGQGDGQEALAGTDPNSPGSFFEVAQSALPATGGFVLQWSSAVGRVYQVLNASNLFEAPLALATNVNAEPPLNMYTVPVESVRESFYFLQVKP